MKQLIAILALLFLFTNSLYSQADTARAMEIASQGVALVDEGKIDEGIAMYRKAMELLPNTFHFPYEIAYAEVMRKNYDKAIEILIPIVDREDATGRGYQLLGNCYDWLGDSAKANVTYVKGIEQFPYNGPLRLEYGIMRGKENDFKGALQSWETGVMVAPLFPSNYYYASVYLDPGSHLWSSIYGELFLNLEPNTKRSATISQLLYAILEHSIIVKDSVQVHFNMEPVTYAKDSVSLMAETMSALLMDVASSTNNNQVQIAQDGSGGEIVNGTSVRFVVPFEKAVTAAYQNAAGNTKSIDFNSILKIRKKYIEYINTSSDTCFDNSYFHWLKKVDKSGYTEPYTAWLLRYAKPDDYKEWASANEELNKNFLLWIKENSYQPNDEKPFSRFFYPGTIEKTPAVVKK